MNNLHYTEHSPDVTLPSREDNEFGHMDSDAGSSDGDEAGEGGINIDLDRLQTLLESGALDSVLRQAVEEGEEDDPVVEGRSKDD